MSTSVQLRYGFNRTEANLEWCSELPTHKYDSVHKFVKLIKVICSCNADESSVDQLLIVQAEPEVGTAHAAVPRETNTAMGRKFS
jgi:hypothetical protein